MTLRLIMNPASRAGKGRRLWDMWETGLRRAGVAFDRAVTAGTGDAFRISRESRDVDAVVAVGGDGTINEVLDGLVQSGDLRRKMGVLYSGTSPDFCRFHGIPTDPHAALACLVAGRARPVDVVRIAYAEADGARRVSHFGCSCNIGLGAAVARFANRWRRVLGDGLGTGLGVVRAIVCSAPVDLELEIVPVQEPPARIAAREDARPPAGPVRSGNVTGGRASSRAASPEGLPGSERLSLPRVNNLSILKNPHLASGLRLDVDLRPDDGRLMLAAVHGKSPAGLCVLLPGFYSGRAAASDAVLLKPCCRVDIRSSGPVDIEFDGDPRGFLPVEIRLLPRAIDLVARQTEEEN